MIQLPTVTVDLIVSGVTQLPNSVDFDEPGGPDDNRLGEFPTQKSSYVTDFAELFDCYSCYPEVKYIETELEKIERKCMS